MSIDVNKLVSKVNFARSSRFLMEHQMIEEHLQFPTTPEEEAESVKRALYFFLKKQFPGCKLRANSLTFSLRLDGEVHNKVKRVRDKVMGDNEWKKWFQENHRDIYRQVERHQQPFRVDGVENRQKDGRDFLYVPVQMNRIQNYNNNGIMNILLQLSEAYGRERALADLFDRITQLMEGEVNRRAEENRRRIADDKVQFERRVAENLIRRITRVNPEGTTFEDKLAAKMYEWCRENDIQPMYALEATYDRVVGIGMNVDIIVRDEDVEEDWYAVPTFGGYELPEGYTLMDGYGDVTAHEPTGRRSREGAAPIVVIRHMYCQYDEKFWKAHFPARYDEVLEATRRFTAEAEAEVAQAAEERRAIERREREERQRRDQEALQQRLQRQLAEQQERDQRTQEEARRQEEAERVERERLAELRRQLLGQLQQAQEIEQAAEPDPTTFPDGIYLNGRAIPLERYVTVYQGTVRRHAGRTGAIDRMRGYGITWGWLGERGVRNYDNVEEVVEPINV